MTTLHLETDPRALFAWVTALGIAWWSLLHLKAFFIVIGEKLYEFLVGQA